MQISEPLHQALTLTEAAYLAGMIDADGTITLTKTKNNSRNTSYIYPKVMIYNTNENLMKWIVSKLGGKYIISVKKGHGKAKKDCYRYDVYGREKQIAFLEKIIPFMIIKKDRATLVKKYLEKRQAKLDRPLIKIRPDRGQFFRKTLRHTPYDKEDWNIMNQVKTLNQGGNTYAHSS